MTAARALLAIDQGTTGSRALLVDREGREIASAYREFPQHFPAPDRVEHDPEEIWASVVAVVREALARADLAARDLAAVGITNQRETTVVWERGSGRPAGRAIVWQDRRTAARCAALRAAGEEERIRAATGLVADPYFSATKLEWILESDPDLRWRAEAGDLCFGTVDAWLIHRLTGGRVHATDHTNASRTLLYSLARGDWDPDLCALFGVPPAMLPEIRPSAAAFGELAPDLFGAAVPIHGVAGDQQAALYGHGGTRAGEAKNTYGTGAFLVLHTGPERGPDVPGVLTTVACGPRGEPERAYEGSILVAGAAIQWLRDGLGLLAAAEESEALAAGVEDTGGVVFVPAFAGLGTPHWEPAARGAVFGLTRGTERAHLVRAALEAMAFATAEALEAMTGPSGVRLAALRADGGAARNDWLLQFQADVLGHEVIRPAATELTALGAARLAGVGSGFLSGPEQPLAALGTPRRFAPSREWETRRREGLARWRRAVDALLHWADGAP
ncbi:MAG: glycerol kinase GlpK [Gemmatimonadota bacterium]|nr:glycerol kinase GlpK [Gemmatimonadota bacterium]